MKTLRILIIAVVSVVSLLIMFPQQASASDIIKVPVIQSVPQYREVQRRIQVGENCTQVQQTRYSNNSNNSVNRNSIGLDTLIGGVAGVAIGNQIGGGNGRTVAKVLGGVLGAGAANSLRSNKHSNSQDANYYKQVCTPVYETVYEQELVCYINYAYVDGIEITKKSRDKLRYINIKWNLEVL